MLKAVLAAILIAGAPLSAFAQIDTTTGSTAGTSSAARPGPTGNQNNPQAETNQAGQPRNARTSPSSGSATSIPTPTLGGSQMKSIPKPNSPRQPGAVH